MSPHGFADIHQHVLWGLDDGPATRKQMHALLRQNVENGVRLVYATAHAAPGLRRFNAELYRERLKEANAYCRKRDWPLRILSGCEMYYSPAAVDALLEGRIPTLGGSLYVLIEFSEDVSAARIGKAANSLYRAGYRPILAHAERYRCLVRSPARAMAVRDEFGLLLQINCETVLRPRGFFRRRFVRTLLWEQAVDVLASDAHDALRRPVQMRNAYRKIAREYDARYAKRLVHLGWRISKLGRAGRV